MSEKRITVWVAEVYKSKYPVPNKRGYMKTEEAAKKYIEINSPLHHSAIYPMEGTLDHGNFYPDNQVMRFR